MLKILYHLLNSTCIPGSRPRTSYTRSYLILTTLLNTLSTHEKSRLVWGQSTRRNRVIAGSCLHVWIVPSLVLLESLFFDKSLNQLKVTLPAGGPHVFSRIHELAFLPPSAHIVRTVPKCSALGSQYLSQDDTRIIIQLYHFLWHLW